MSNKDSMKSFSLVELILAIGIFSIFTIGALGYLLTSYKITLSNSDYLKADIYLQSGIDILTFIKRANWESVKSGNYGLSFDGSKWNLVPDYVDIIDSKYKRSVSISDVFRDQNGKIVNTGGDLDQYTKKIIIKLSWELQNKSTQTLTKEVYQMNWEKNVPTEYGGMLVYADFSGSDDVIKYKILNRNKSWSEEKAVPDFGVPSNRDTRRVELYSSTTRNEYILITKHTEDGQFIYANVYKDGSWGNPIKLAGYGDNANPNTRNFDGTYLANGNFLVVYDDFTYYPKFRIWNGSSWSSQGTVGYLGYLSYPVWVQLKQKPNGNDALVTIRDALQHTNTSRWNNGSWSALILHGSSSSGISIDNISTAWSRFDNKYFALMFNEWPDNYPNIRIWNDSSSSWSSNVENENVGGRALIFDIVDSPKSINFMGCVKDSNRTINCMKTTSNPLWTNSFRVASNTNENAEKSFASAYESKSGDDMIIVYSGGMTKEDQKIPKFRLYNESTQSWSSESVLPELGPDGTSALSTVRTISSPKGNDIFVMLGDEKKSLTTVVWNGEDNSFYKNNGYAFMKQAIYGSNIADFWYSFAWKINE